MTVFEINNLRDNFRRFCEELKLGPDAEPVLVAVSGGIDSVVLCDLCACAGLNFVIAHCNFGLRGEESQRDEEFVRDLGRNYRTEVLVKNFDTARHAEQEKRSIQEAARMLRYEWFYALCQSRNFPFVFTAHHADDNIETMLMNFFRGTGLPGLTGMPRERDLIVRPLLYVRKELIVGYARDRQLKWVDDTSNISLKYTRNFFRNRLIPELKTVFPTVEENLLHTIDRFKNINALYETMVSGLKDKLLERRGPEVRIPVKKLLKYPLPALLFEIIKDYGFGEKQVKDVAQLLRGESGKFIENGLYQVIRHGNWLVVAPKFARREMIAIEKRDAVVSYDGGSVEFVAAEKPSIQLDRSPTVAQLDLRHIEYPLILRKWKQGDYFYPLGMRKKKKLARFFIDQKLSRNRKDEVWVLESNKKIIWVVGMRIDDRFKITEQTRSLLVITYKNEIARR